MELSLNNKISKLTNKPNTDINISGGLNLEQKIIAEEIKLAKMEWESAYSSFDYAEDELMLDYYTYKIKACQIRLEYLFKKAKEAGMVVGA